MMSQLEFTGERLVPSVNGKIATEHLHRYAFTFDFVKGKEVLDIASGEGYGSNLLSDYSAEVLGIDISKEAIFHAQKKYLRPNLKFKEGSVLNIPCESGIFDVVVSFETIEHISDHQRMISEIKRVLKSDGFLIISTPEKSIYSDQANYSNPYHEHELYEKEFVDLLEKSFKYVELGYQKYLAGSYIIPRSNYLKNPNYFVGDFNRIHLGGFPKGEYLIAVCSNSELKQNFSFSIFDDFELAGEKLEDILASRIKKIKSGFRYRLIDVLFKPWDFFKNKVR